MKDLFVINNVHSGVISANIVLPMAFRIDSENNGVKGDLPVSLLETTILDNEDLKILRNIIEEINTVLYTIIPGLRIEIKEYGSQLMDNGEEGYKIELMSSREGMPSYPIRMESEGIIKIISILNALIQAFSDSSICLAIDELDAGIFEYILGELLQIFDESAKGQLIFTSHNLRALEMLEKESIMFSTTNSSNQYIHMKNIKQSNNLRDVYLRSITLGGQKEEIYKETSSLKIARAFRKAGRCVKIMNEKKVILFIVEGPSDRAALGPIMEEYFNSEDIKFLIVHGDITIKNYITKDNAIIKVNEQIKEKLKELKKNIIIVRQIILR